MDEALKGTKALLRSTLQSVKGGVPIRNLNRDFRDITGENIPFKKFGYNTLDAFLQAVPDVVRVTSKDGEWYCSAIADETTAHIEKMVSRQRPKKTSKKKGLGGLRRPFLRSSNRQNFAAYRFGTSYKENHVRPNYKPQPIPRAPYHQAYSKQTPTFPRDGAERSMLQRSVGCDNGAMRVTFSRTPPRPNNSAPSSSSYMHGSIPSSTPSEKSGIKFGANYKVPPRFLRSLNVQNFTDSREYKNILYGHLGKRGLTLPKYETVKSGLGFASIVSIEAGKFDSGGVHRTKTDAEQASARNACTSLGLEKVPQVKIELDFNLELVKKRVTELMKGRTNGLWLNRLPVTYKERFNEDPPNMLSQILYEWEDIVSIEPTHNANLKIVYPVTKGNSSSKLSPPRTSHQSGTSVDNTLSQVPTSSEESSNISFSLENDLIILEAQLPRVGCKIRVYVSFVTSVFQFFIHLESSSITEIMQDLNNTYGGKSTYPDTKLECGRFVAAKCEDEYWYRGQIVNTFPNKECEIMYVDFGNCEVMDSSRVQALKSTLYKTPSQAIRCSLASVFPRRDASLSAKATALLNSMLEELNTDEELVCSMKIIENKDNTCFVELFVGDKSVNQELLRKGLVRMTPKDSIKAPGPLQLPPDSEWEVYVAVVLSANQVILRLLGAEYSEKLNQLEEDMAQVPLPQTTCVPEVGDLCAAKISGSTEEGESPWYRVRVKELVHDEKATCECVDYGDYDDVPLSLLRPLLPDEAKLPFQTIVAYLSGLEGCEHDAKMKTKLTEMAMGKSLIATVESREGDPSISLYDTSTSEDIKINEALVLATDLAMTPPTLPNVGDMCEVYLSHIDSEGNVFLQIQGPGLLELEALSAQVNETLSVGGAKYFVSDLREDKMVLAPFSDGGWYRGVITDVLPNMKVLLHFVDYGNQEVLPCSALRDLEKSNKKLFNLPRQAIAVTLDELPPPGFTWVDSAIDELCALAPTDQLIQVETISQDSSLPVVHLYRVEHCPDIEFFSINQEITDPKFWVDTTIEPPIEQEPEPETEPEPEANTSFSDASVASQQVLLESADVLRDVSDVLLSMSLDDAHPELSPICGTGENDQFCREFQATDEQTDLNSNNTKMNAPINYDSMPMPPPLEPPSSGSLVYVTCASDPSNFRCVSSSALSKIDMIKDDMARFYSKEGDLLTVEVKDLRIGGLYAGYHENKGWYRITVKNIINQPLISATTMISAQFMDFGEFFLLPASSVRNLPAQFRELPFQVMKAKLAGVEAEAGIWSADAIERFESLVLEKTLTAFIYLSEADESVVSMSLVDVDEEGENGLIHKKLIIEGLAVSSPIPKIQ